MSFLRDELRRRRVHRNENLLKLRNNALVQVSGLVLVRQRPSTAKGVIFETLEDETGVANIVIWAKTFEAYRKIVLGARCVMVRGRLQSHDGVIHVVAHHMEDLTPLMLGISDDALTTQGLANADEVQRPVEEQRLRTKPASALARLLQAAPELRGDAETISRARAARTALPKGRNFH